MYLRIGTYGVTVIDDNGCLVAGSYTITEPAMLELTATTIDVSCFGYGDGSIDITVVGGTMRNTY